VVVACAFEATRTSGVSAVVAAAYALGITNEDFIAAAVANAAAATVTADAFSTTDADTASAAVSACVSACDPGIETTSGDGEELTVAVITDTVAAGGNPTVVTTDAGGNINVITAAFGMYLTTTAAAAIYDYSCCFCSDVCGVCS